MAISLRPRLHAPQPAVVRLRCPRCEHEWEAMGLLDADGVVHIPRKDDGDCPECGRMGDEVEGIVDDVTTIGGTVEGGERDE